MRATVHFTLASAMVVLLCAICGARESDSAGKSPSRGQGQEAADIFNRRIRPMINAPNPSSCTECHFAGVELRHYVANDQAATFAALRDNGLIDVNNPDNSKLLDFIRRKPAKENPLLAKVRRNEYEAFRSWIRAAVKDPGLLRTKATEVRVGSELSDEVIRHTRRDRVLSSFVENIWTEIGRCINCHSPDRNQKVVLKHGEQVSWIRPGDPGGTLEQCLDQGLIDVDDPEQSSLLLKPIAQEVDHGGGPKFVVGSRTDKGYRRFLKDYANVVNKKYQRKDQLPIPTTEVSALTHQHLRIVDLPERYGKKLLQVDIHRWQDGAWSQHRWATADNPINGQRRMWQSMVLAVAPRGSERAKQLSAAAELPPGRYLVKVFVDAQDKTKANRDYELGGRELLGTVEIQGPWKPGYQPPKIIHAPVGP